MARDSSPFAQRLKALANRATRPSADDSAENAAVPEPHDPAAAVPSDDQPTQVNPAVAAAGEVDPDEQPTGEFPAIQAEAVPVADTGIYASNPDAAALTDQPDPAAVAADQGWSTSTTDAFSPIPSQYDPAPDASPFDEPLAVEHDLQPVDAPSHAAPSDFATSVEPSNAVAPADEPSNDPASRDETPTDVTPEDPAPAWPTVVPPPPVKPPTSVPAPGYEPPTAQQPPVQAPSVRPIWLDPPAEPVGQPAADAQDSAPGDATAPTPSGPTLQPPVLPKKDIVEPVADAPTLVEEPATDATTMFEAVTEAPAEPTPVIAPEPTSTPAALNDALALPDDDEPTSQPEPAIEQPLDTAPTEIEATPVIEPAADAEPPTQAVDNPELTPTPAAEAPTEPPRRIRLTRPGFLKRGADQPADALATDASSTDQSSDDAAWDAVVRTVDGEPATTQFEATPAPSDAPAPSDELAAATAADPGSITSRFRLRRAKTDRPDEPTTTPAVPAPSVEAPAAIETVPEPAAPAAALLTAEPVPYKPSFSERAALRRRAKSLRGRRDAGLLELGAIVLDQSRFGDPSGGSLVRRRTSELADLDSEIAAIEIALDDERSAETVKQLGVVHCTSCSALLGPADRFCANCGSAHPGPGDGGSETSAS